MADPPSHAAAATVTRLLNEAAEGDARAAASLLPLVYDQLRAAQPAGPPRPDPF